MIATMDPVAEVENRIVKDIKESALAPHQRLAAERKLADIYKVPRMRVHQAIMRLVEKGYFYSKRGSGTFVSGSTLNPEAPSVSALAEEVLSFPSFIPSNDCEKIKLNLPILDGGQQAQAWKKVIDKFKERCPFVQVDIEFGLYSKFENLDLFIAYPYDLRAMKNMASEMKTPGNKNFFSKKIFDVCKIDDKLLAVPILRVPSLVSVNLDILKVAKIGLPKLEKPADLMRLGAEVETALQGQKTKGLRFLGGLFHGALYGIQFTRKGNRIEFDEAKIARFLEDAKPYIKQHHFIPHKESGLDKFLRGEYCIYPHFSTGIPDLTGKGVNVANIKLPLADDGFVCEGMFIGGVNSNSKNKEEATMLLDYLTSKEAQETLTEELPFCLSVREDILSQQEKEASPELKGIHAEFDIRSYYTQLDSVIFDEYGKKLNTESGKYFFGMQNISKTIERLKYTNSGEL